MIFNPSTINKELKPSEKDKWKLGILDLTPNDNETRPFPAQDYESNGSFVKIFDIDADIVKKIEIDRPINYEVKARPTIFKQESSNGDKSIGEEYVLVTPDSYQTKEKPPKKIFGLLLVDLNNR